MIKVQGIDLRIRTLSFRLVAYVEARVPILENDMNKMMDNEMGAVCVCMYIYIYIYGSVCNLRYLRMISRSTRGIINVGYCPPPQ